MRARCEATQDSDVRAWPCCAPSSWAVSKVIAAAVGVSLFPPALAGQTRHRRGTSAALSAYFRRSPAPPFPQPARPPSGRGTGGYNTFKSNGFCNLQTRKQAANDTGRAMGGAARNLHTFVCSTLHTLPGMGGAAGGGLWGASASKQEKAIKDKILKECMIDRGYRVYSG